MFVTFVPCWSLARKRWAGVCHPGLSNNACWHISVSGNTVFYLILYMLFRTSPFGKSWSDGNRFSGCSLKKVWSWLRTMRWRSRSDYFIKIFLQVFGLFQQPFEVSQKAIIAMTSRDCASKHFGVLKKKRKSNQGRREGRQTCRPSTYMSRLGPRVHYWLVRGDVIGLSSTIILGYVLCSTYLHL